MKIITHKCPNCGSSLKLKKGQTEGVCEYCKVSFSLDDEVIRIEQKTTVEVKNDNYLEIAMTTLENFKDYRKSEILFKSLIYDYGHKKEIYIGLIRSITHDFSKQIQKSNVLDVINEYWHKYKSLATPKEVSRYEESINEINKKYWYKELISTTGNFKVKDSDNLKDIEQSWDNYIKFCSEKEKEVIEIKYKDFLNNKKQDIKQKKKSAKVALGIIVLLLIIAFIIDYIVLTTEQIDKKQEEINLSLVLSKCKETTCEDTSFLQKYFKEHKSKLIIKDVSLDKKEKVLLVTTILENRYKRREDKIKFNLIDDMGPIITPTKCIYNDTDNIDINTCFNLYDYTDGIIENNKAEVQYDLEEFKTEGNKTIIVSITDKDGNKTTEEVPVLITKTPIELSIEISDKINVGETIKLNYNITPNYYPHNEIEIKYDQNYISIDENNNVKGLKKGQTTICLNSKYDESSVCEQLEITLNCQNTYVFKFDGGKSETKIAGETFCPGTYKVYASVLNKKEFYSIQIKGKNEFSGQHMTIYKESSFLSDEGSKYVFNEGTSFVTEPGITQVKLVKVS